MTRLEIEAFLTIIKEGSMLRASDLLYVTQPALSRRIQSLETELGYQLFSREKGFRSVTLTEKGRLFLPIAERFLALYTDAMTLSESHEKPTIHISSISSLASSILPNILRQATKPETPYYVDFHCHHSQEAYQYVSNGLLNLALIDDPRDIHRNTREQVHVEEIFHQKFVLLAGRNLTKKYPGRVVFYSDLDPSEEILLPYNAQFEIWHQQMRPFIFPKLKLDTIFNLLPQILTEDSYAVVPEITAAFSISKDLNFLSLLDGPPDISIYAARHVSDLNNPYTDHFLQLVRNELQKIHSNRFV